MSFLKNTWSWFVALSQITFVMGILGFLLLVINGITLFFDKFIAGASITVAVISVGTWLVIGFMLVRIRYQSGPEDWNASIGQVMEGLTPVYFKSSNSSYKGFGMDDSMSSNSTNVGVSPSSFNPIVNVNGTPMANEYVDISGNPYGVD